MSDEAPQKAGPRARYKYTVGGIPHPNVQPSEHGQESLSKTPGGLRVKSKPLPMLAEGEQLTDHLGPVPVLSVRTRRVHPETSDNSDMPSERNHGGQGAVHSIRPSQQGAAVEMEERSGESDGTGSDGGTAAPEVLSGAHGQSPVLAKRDKGKGKAQSYANDSNVREGMQSLQVAIRHGSIHAEGEPNSSSKAEAFLTEPLVPDGGVRRSLIVKLPIGKPALNRTDTTETREAPIATKPAPSQGQPAQTKRRTSKYTNDPPRQVTRPNPVPLRMDVNMAPYHGSKHIPRDIVILRNDIRNNFLTANNTIRAKAINGNHSDLFQTDGRMKAGNKLVEFYMDLRLFSEKAWDSMTLEYRPDTTDPPRRKIVKFARLSAPTFNHAFAGKPAGDVPKPPGWDYDADLVFHGEEDEDEDAMSISNDDAAEAEEDVEDGTRAGEQGELEDEAS